MLALSVVLVAVGVLAAPSYAASPPNLLSAMNPSFEAATDGWDFSGSAVTHTASTSWALDANNSLHIKGSATNNDVSAFSSFVPVAAGRTYSSRISARVTVKLQGMRVAIEWWNASSMIGQTLGARIAATGGAVGTATASGAAPSGATRARLRILDDGTGTWDADLDGAMLVDSASVPANFYTDLPANLLAAMNPSFDWAQDGWSFSHAATPSVDWAYDGTASMHITGKVANNDVSAFSSFAPVTPGKFYSARLTAHVMTKIQGMRLQIEWWNDAAKITESQGPAISDTGGSDGTASVTGLAPAGATRARLRAADVGTGTWDAYLDAAMLVEGGVPSSYYTTPLPTNLLAAMNPSLEFATDGWAFSHAATPSTAWAYDGGSSVHVTGTVSNNDVSAWSSFVPVTPGKFYSARLTAHVMTKLTGMKLRIEWWNDSAQISDVTGGAISDTGGSDGTASVTGTAPTGATRARLRAFDFGTGTWDAYLDAAMLVEGGIPSSYYNTPRPENLLSAMNPSFVWASDGWAFSQAAAPSTAWAYDGSTSMHVTGTVSNNDVSAWSSFVPVTPGKFYSARLTAHVMTKLTGMKLRIEWWNDAAQIGDVTGGAISDTGGSDGTASVTGTAPTGATRARLRAFDFGTGTWDAYLDAAMLVEGGIPSMYYETPLPANQLWSVNPSFELGLAGWTFCCHDTEVASTSWAYSGSTSAHVTGTVSNNDVSAFSSFVPVTPGKFYSARITAHVMQKIQGMRLQIEWWNNTTKIVESQGSPISDTGGSDGTASVTGLAPAGATRARLRAVDVGTGTWDAYLDAAMLVEGGIPSSYYDCWASWRYGGLNRTIDTDSEKAEITTDAWGADGNPQAILQGLCPADYATVMSLWNTTVWAAEPSSIDFVDYAADGSGSFMWLSSNSADHRDAQWRMSVNNGPYTGWVTTQDGDFTTPTGLIPAGAQVAIEVREIDGAGVVVSATTQKTFTAPTNSARGIDDPDVPDISGAPVSLPSGLRLLTRSGFGVWFHLYGRAAGFGLGLQGLGVDIKPPFKLDISLSRTAVHNLASTVGSTLSVLSLADVAAIICNPVTDALKALGLGAFEKLVGKVFAACTAVLLATAAKTTSNVVNTAHARNQCVKMRIQFDAPDGTLRSLIRLRGFTSGNKTRAFNCQDNF